MKHYIRHILICGAVLSLSAMPMSGAPDITIKAELDSAYLLMGKRTAMHIEVVGELNEKGEILTPDSLWTDVEVSSITEPVITDLGNGRKELKQDIILQSFDSGLYNLPPVIYYQGDEMAQSNRLALKVIPVPVDTLKTVHDYADIKNPPRHVFDFMPDWATDYGLWIILALLVIGASIFVYLKWLRKGKIPLIPTKKPIPPYELAIKQLEDLKEEKLCERGEEKAFYTRLTDILRVYLETRFGINAMEMTTTQILKALTSNEATRVPKKYMSEILRTADFVKFANVRPLPDDNVQSFRSALKFVEDTKPVEVPENEATDDATSNDDSLKDKKD